MATYRNQNPNKKFYKTNQYINAQEVRLVDEDAKQIGVVSIMEARRMSQETGLDLVEIAPLAKPPVVKLIEFAKFKYQESKKAKAEKRGIKGGELKEIQMTPFISTNDYETGVKKAQKFLSTGNKVKLSIKFQGRQIQHQEFGHNLVKKFLTDMAEFGTPEGEAKLMGKRLILGLTPTKKNK
ncbi:translation initiation factor IF-3 [Candidatus Shapirobacteria bacterium]|nr:translation initiation factor IF-3 [Candidatus Shapirobacteria bacterium]